MEQTTYYVITAYNLDKPGYLTYHDGGWDITEDLAEASEYESSVLAELCIANNELKFPRDMKITGIKQIIIEYTAITAQIVNLAVK